MGYGGFYHWSVHCKMIVTDKQEAMMKPFRKHVAIAIDGGGIKGVIVTRALEMLQRELGKPLKQVFGLTAGTSTGAIISAGIAAGLSASQLHRLYLELGPAIFKKTLRGWLWPLTGYRYDPAPLEKALRDVLGNKTMGDFWQGERRTDVVITLFDLLENRVRLAKPWKSEYKDWEAVKVVLASSSAPTYMPTVDGRFVDGGVGSYANPCYLAAYEAKFCLCWNPAETTLISLGTGRTPLTYQPGQADCYRAWDWVAPLLGAFLDSANDQQVNLVDMLFDRLDFRRFQVDLPREIGMDDARAIPELLRLGETMGDMILHDRFDRSLGQTPECPVVEDGLGG